MFHLQSYLTPDLKLFDPTGHAAIPTCVNISQGNQFFKVGKHDSSSSPLN